MKREKSLPRWEALQPTLEDLKKLEVDGFITIKKVVDDYALVSLVPPFPTFLKEGEAHA